MAARIEGPHEINPENTEQSPEIFGPQGQLLFEEPLLTDESMVSDVETQAQGTTGVDSLSNDIEDMVL